MTLAQLSVRPSPIHGLGVFADQEIPAGTLVIEYRGERVSAEEARHREARRGPGVTHLLWYDNTTLLDGAIGGNEARFINHSCAPNCSIVRQDGRAFIRAITTIPSGSELFLDYAFAPGDEIAPCRCGAPECRGVLNETETETDHASTFVTR